MPTLIAALLLSLLQAPAGQTARPVEFPSLDGLTVRADLYLASPAAPDSGAEARASGAGGVGASPLREGLPASVAAPRPFLVLCHQAGSSRGEYASIAPRLTALGCDALAIDQRSGQAMAGVENLTARRAREALKGTSYLDAEQDILAALRWARKEQAPANGPGARPLILWGSSYSASLVLKIAAEHPDLVDGVLSFSPGEYFTNLGRSGHFVADAARAIKVPVLITSARDEAGNWKAIHEAIGSAHKTGFVPALAGRHGSRTLWASTPGSEEYWKAVESFLAPFLAPADEQGASEH